MEESHHEQAQWLLYHAGHAGLCPFHLTTPEPCPNRLIRPAPSPSTVPPAPVKGGARAPSHREDCRAGVRPRRLAPSARANPARGVRGLPARKGGVLDVGGQACRARLPFWNLPSPSLTPAGLSRAPQAQARSPTAFTLDVTYFCSILEHLGKARGLGDVERHG